MQVVLAVYSSLVLNVNSYNERLKFFMSTPTRVSPIPPPKGLVPL